MINTRKTKRQDLKTTTHTHNTGATDTQTHRHTDTGRAPHDDETRRDDAPWFRRASDCEDESFEKGLVWREKAGVGFVKARWRKGERRGEDTKPYRLAEGEGEHLVGV